jgi:hypothetical protein
MNGNDVSVHAMKVYRESRGTTPLILNLGNIWRRWCNFRPGKKSDTQKGGGWMSTTDGRDILEKWEINAYPIPGFESRTVKPVA